MYPFSEGLRAPSNGANSVDNVSNSSDLAGAQILGATAIPLGLIFH